MTSCTNNNSREKSGTAGHREREPLLLAPLPSPPTIVPGRVGSRQRARRQDAWAEEKRLRGRAGATLTTLQELSKGTLTDAVVGWERFTTGGSSSSTSSGAAVLHRLQEEHRMRPVLPGVPQGDGAFVRLAGEATFRKFALPLSPRGSGKTCSSVPLRGEIHEMNIGAIGLPKPGTRPVAAESVSGRARALFQNIENVMINPNRERGQQESGVES